MSFRTLRDEDGPDADTRVLVATGDFDFDTGGHLQRRVATALAGGVRRIVVDLTAAGYIDTRALAALIEADRDAKRHGAVLAVVSPADARLRVILELTRLDRYLQLAETRQDAVAA